MNAKEKQQSFHKLFWICYSQVSILPEKFFLIITQDCSLFHIATQSRFGSLFHNVIHCEFQIHECRIFKKLPEDSMRFQVHLDVDDNFIDCLWWVILTIQLGDLTNKSTQSMTQSLLLNAFYLIQIILDGNLIWIPIPLNIPLIVHVKNPLQLFRWFITPCKLSIGIMQVINTEFCVALSWGVGWVLYHFWGPRVII